jgi:hypothetical protein
MYARMKTSNHLVVGYAFEEALDREAQTRRSPRWNRKNRFRAVLNHLCNHLCQALLRDSREPRIREITDRSGVTHWRVYDPQTDRSLRFDTETEVLQWLDRRYSANGMA